MNKETLIKVFTMRIDGSTYQEIGENLGFSKQYVEQELKQSINKEKTTYAKRYPKREKVVEYMADNNLSINEFSKLLEIPYSNLSNFMRGQSQSLKTAMKIADYTGLTLEQILGIAKED